jgi:hypothetical protein
MITDAAVFGERKNDPFSGEAGGEKNAARRREVPCGVNKGSSIRRKETVVPKQLVNFLSKTRAMTLGWQAVLLKGCDRKALGEQGEVPQGGLLCACYGTTIGGVWGKRPAGGRYGCAMRDTAGCLFMTIFVLEASHV